MPIQIEVLVQVVADFLHKPTQNGKKRKNILWKEVAAEYTKRTGINDSNNRGQLKKAYSKWRPRKETEGVTVEPGSNTLSEAVAKAKKDGTSVLRLKNGVYNESTFEVTIDFSLRIIGQAETIVRSGFVIRGNDRVRLETMTVTNTAGNGVVGVDFDLKNLSVDGCRRTGVYVSSGQGTLTDCTVTNCGWSGIEAAGNGVIHIEGESTKVTGNCTDYEEREENEYGLCARSRAVIILHTPLTKGWSWGNGDGDITSPDEDWGGEGTIVEEVYDELFKACQQNNPDMVARYVGHIDVNHEYRDEHHVRFKPHVYYTLLKAAAESGNLQIVNILLGVDGIDVNLHGPIVYAAAKGHANVVRKLLTVKGIGRTGIFSDWRGRRDPLWAAIKHDKTEVALMLIEYYVDHGLPTDFSTDGKTPLWNACKSGNVKIVRVLLELFAHYKYWGEGRYPVNHQDSHHIYQTPLSIACENGHLQVVLELLKNTKIKVNLATNDGRTPLFIACQEGRLEIAQALLKDSRVDVNQTDKNRATPLSVACEQGHKDIVRMLLTVRPKWKIVYLPKNVDTLPPQKQRAILAEDDHFLERMASPELQRKLNGLYIRNEIKKLVWKRDNDFWEDVEGNNANSTPDQFIKIAWPELVDDGVTYYCEDFELKTVENVFTLTTFQNCTFPDNTFTLNAHDSFSLMDGIDCPVRCLPCKHPFEASALKTWFQQPKKQDNPNGDRHNECPECRTIPKSIELMSEIQVERWNTMANVEKNAESELQSLRTNTSMYDLQGQMNADTKKDVAQKTAIAELNKKIQALRTQKDVLQKTTTAEHNKKIQALRTQKDVLHQAAEKTRKRLGKNQNNAQYNTYVKKMVAAKKAVSENSLKRRFKSRNF